MRGLACLLMPSRRQCSPPSLLPPLIAPTARYEEGFEPYVIVSRKFVPWYDERFVGYRKNKVRGRGGARQRGPGTRPAQEQRVRVLGCRCSSSLRGPGRAQASSRPPFLLPRPGPTPPPAPQVVHLLYLSTSGIQFVVHPRAFAVHSPHPRARTWKVTHKTGLWDQVGAPGGNGRGFVGL